MRSIPVRIYLFFTSCVIALSSVTLHAEPALLYEFKIKRQSVAAALLDFSNQSDIQVIMPGELAGNVLANEVTGQYTAREALTRLLQSTGLEYVFSSDETVTIRRFQQIRRKTDRRRKRLEQLGLEQMFVKGEQQQTLVRDTTVSQVALSGEDLETRGVKNADELQQFVPSLTVESPQTASTEFSIRGAGISNDDLSSQPGVAVFIDDVYIPRQSTANMALYELDRVEILRGPQSTLYGRNATGGSIVYITRKPTADFEGKYFVEAGNYNHFNNLLTVNGELSEGVTGLVALASFQRGPIMQNSDPFIGGNDADSNSGRLAFRVSRSENYEWLFSFDGESRRQQAVLYSIGPDGPFRFAEGLPGVEISDPVRTSDVDTPGFEKLDLLGMMARLNVHAGSHEASYIFGRRTHEFNGLYDLDQSPELLVNKHYYEDSDTQSFEARWSSKPLTGTGPPGTSQWRAGLLAMKEKASAIKRYQAPGLFAGDNQWDQTIEEISYSGYGQVQYQITNRFRFVGGVRYISDYRHFSLAADSSLPGPDNPYLQEEYSYKQRRVWRQVTPRFACYVQIAPESSLYLSASSGYKPGGYNGASENLARARTEYDEERVASYELGLKTNGFDNRVKLNTAFFWAHYQNMQVSAADGVGNAVVQNAEDAVSKGFEAELQARPLTSFKVSVGVSYIDARFRRFLYDTGDGTIIDKHGDRVPRVPELTYSLSAVYLFPDTPLGSWSFRVDTAYSDSAENINNDPAWLSYRSYNLWLDYLPHNGRWELSLWVRNLSNKEYFQASSPGITNAELAFARKLESPRTAGMGLKYFW